MPRNDLISMGLMGLDLISMGLMGLDLISMGLMGLDFRPHQYGAHGARLQTSSVWGSWG